jgi:hypothetical protein
MESDPLSEALSSVRLTGAIFLDAELGMPWGFASPPASTASHLLAPTAEHLVLFHLLVEGQATARVPGSDSVPLEAGDIVVLARGDAHELWNGSVSELTDASSLLPKILNGAIRRSVAEAAVRSRSSFAVTSDAIVTQSACSSPDCRPCSK